VGDAALLDMELSQVYKWKCHWSLICISEESWSKPRNPYWGEAL